MKKILLLSVLSFFVLQGQAQILKSIVNSAANQAQKSATNKVSEKVNKQVDKGVNKLFDSLIKEDTTKTPEKEVPAVENNNADKAPAALNGFMKKLGVSTETIPHKAEYQFTGTISEIFEATDEKGKKVTSTESETWLNEKNSDLMFKLTATNDEATHNTIFDHENSCLLSLSNADGKKTGFATKFDPNAVNNVKPIPDVPNAEGEPSKAIDVDCTPVLTGNKAKISGFNCFEYRCETSEAIVTAWVTKDLLTNNSKLFSNPAFGRKNYQTESFDGMVIKYETKSKVDRSSSLMLIKSIDMNKASSFSTIGYEISSFNINTK